MPASLACYFISLEESAEMMVTTLKWDMAIRGIESMLV